MSRKRKLEDGSIGIHIELSMQRPIKPEDRERIETILRHHIETNPIVQSIFLCRTVGDRMVRIISKADHTDAGEEADIPHSRCDAVFHCMTSSEIVTVQAVRREEGRVAFGYAQENQMAEPGAEK